MGRCRHTSVFQSLDEQENQLEAGEETLSDLCEPELERYEAEDEQEKDGGVSRKIDCSLGRLAHTTCLRADEITWNDNSRPHQSVHHTHTSR